MGTIATLTYFETTGDLTAELRHELNYNAFTTLLDLDATLQFNFTQRSLTHLIIDLELFKTKLIGNEDLQVELESIIDYLKGFKD